MYEPRSQIPSRFAAFSTWLLQELRSIAAAVNAPDVPEHTLQQLHAEPAKLRNGLTVLADGSDWDPGSGQGVYTYYNAQWNKLG